MQLQQKPKELPICPELCFLGSPFATLAGPPQHPTRPRTRLTDAYDAAVVCADPSDVGIGSATTRVHDFVNRGPAFDPLYVHPPVMEACELVIKEPFKLSAMAARTFDSLRPGRRLQVRRSRMADARLHIHARRLPTRQRSHTIRTALPPLV